MTFLWRVGDPNNRPLLGFLSSAKPVSAWGLRPWLTDLGDSGFSRRAAKKLPSAAKAGFISAGTYGLKAVPFGQL